MCGEDTPHYIFINVDSERVVDLLCNPGASESWIALLQFDDCLDELVFLYDFTIAFSRT